MSIELGRGVKRGAHDHDADISEQRIVFNMGGDSLYELTESPPVASQRVRSTSQKKPEEGGLRRQASIQAAKRASSTKQPRSLSEALHKARVEHVDGSFLAEEAGNTATFNTRNTRFARSRQTSAAQPQQQTPRRNTTNNATAQSNSFMLPDLPNIAELVSGTRRDGTPLFARTTKHSSQSRSRFTSGTYNSKPLRPEHVPIESVPVPEDEKAIYASLQLLRDRVAQLEVEKSEATKRAEEREIDIIELRAQLAVAQKRPDSGLGSSAGSGDEDADGHIGKGHAKLQASVKSLQGQLGRSERKTSVAEISLQRITMERDELITQIGVAYYNNEELKAENDTFRSHIEDLGPENEELKAEVDVLRQENQELRVLVAQTRAAYEDDATRRSARQTAQAQKKTTAATGLSEREIREAARLVMEQTPRRAPQAQEKIRDKRNAISDQTGQATYASHGIAATLGEATSDDLAVRIAQEVRKNREAQVATDRKARSASQINVAHARQRSRSKSQTRPATASKQPTVPAREHDLSDAESTTQLDFAALRNRKRASVPTPTIAANTNAVQKEEDERDLTLLSWMDPNKFSELRRKIEAEHRAKRLGNARATSAPSGDAAAMMSGGLSRKSSMKDVTIGSEKRDFTATSGFGQSDFAKVAKSVRVQSPHSSFDAAPYPTQTQNIDQHTADISMASNTSRRRRRAASAEGMTSAFILPDITLSGRGGLTKPAHDAGNCTACTPGTKDITIPTPVPVTDRTEDIPVDITSATIRPSQPPPLALATVIKQLQDEIAHLKHLLTVQQRLYNQHDPALSKRRRVQLKATMDQLTADIEKRSDQVYSLYDVLEGQKAAEAAGANVDDFAVEETLESLGIDPAELSGTIGRGMYGNGAPFGFDGASDLSGDLPFEGFSDAGEQDSVSDRRRSREF